MATCVFLELNGYRFAASEEPAAQAVLCWRPATWTKQATALSFAPK